MAYVQAMTRAAESRGPNGAGAAPTAPERPAASPSSRCRASSCCPARCCRSTSSSPAIARWSPTRSRATGRSAWRCCSPGWEAGGDDRGSTRWAAPARSSSPRSSRTALQHPSRGALPLPRDRGSARGSLPRRRVEEIRSVPFPDPGEEQRVTRAAAALFGNVSPGRSSCRPCPPRASPPSGWPRRSRCACATRPRSSRRSSRPTRCRRGSRRSRGRMLEWKGRVRFLAPFRPKDLDPAE